MRPPPITSPLDVLYLTFLPPYLEYGSFNRLVGTIIRRLGGLRQASLSYEIEPRPTDQGPGSSFLTVNESTLSARDRAWMRLPERLRRVRFNGIGDRAHITFLLGVLEQLPLLRPAVVVCFDDYKFGSLLRRAVGDRARVVLSQHGFSYYLAGGGHPYKRTAFDAVWSLSKASYRFDRERFSEYEPCVSVLPNGVDTRRFCPASPDERRGLRDRYGLPEARPLVLSLGRLVPKKGLHLALESWADVVRAVPDVFLWVVGRGDPAYASHLRRLVEAQGLDGHVKFQGAVPASEVQHCYRAADLYLFPTAAAEGCPLSVLEAMACGLPCLMSEFGFASESFTEAEARLVADPNLAGAFVGPTIELLRDPEASRRLGRNARALVEREYEEDLWLSRVETFLRNQILLAGRCTN